MRTYTTPGEQTVGPSDNPVSLLALRASDDPNSVALSHRVGDGFEDITVGQTYSTVKELAAGLLALGVQKGDRVAIFCSTRYEFTLF